MLIIDIKDGGIHHDIDKETLRNISILCGSVKESEIRTVEVSYTQALKYAGDFAGLLRTLDVYDHFISATITINGLKSSTSYDGNFTSIRLIDAKKIKSILKMSLPRKK